MADDQAQSGGSVSSSTVDAFIAAPEETQRTALTRMSAPAKAALLGALKTRQAAGTLKPAATSQPTTSPIPPQAPPSAPPPPQEKSPGLYDRATGAILNFFRPLSADERVGIESHIGKVLGPVVEGVSNVALGATQGAGSLVFHPLSSIYGTAQTAADALNQLFPDSKLTPQQKKAKDASLARLKDQWHEVKDNPDFALGNLFGSIEAGKIIGESVAKTVANPRETINTIKKPLEAAHRTAQAVVGGGERQVKAVVETAAENANTAREATLEANRRADEATLEDRGKIDEANLKARRQAKQEAREAQKAADAKEPYLKDNQVYESARQAHDRVVNRQEEIEGKREKLSTALDQTRQDVYSRLQNTRAAARAYFHKAYGDIEDAGDGHGVSLEQLNNDVNDARAYIKGSEDSLKVFNDIDARFNHPDVDLKNPPPDSIYAKDEWKILTKKAKEKIWNDAMKEAEERGDEKISPMVSLEDLNGYYSELGRFVSGKGPLGDLKTAAEALRKSIDRRIEETYGEDLAKQNKRVRAQYKNFAQDFLDTGSSDVAKAVSEPDYYRGTQSMFLSDTAQQKAVRGRVRSQIVGDKSNPATQYLPKEIYEGYTRDPETGEMVGSGDKTPAWRYRRETHRQIERMRNLQKGLESLPSQEKLAKEVSDSEQELATARELARQKAAAKPEQKPYAKPNPTKPVDVPELDPRRIRDDLITEKLRQWTSITKFQFARLAGGPIGLAVGLAVGGGYGHLIELGSLIYTGAELTPFALQKALDRPGVREWFTRPPAGEVETLQKIPHADRVKIANTFRGMVREADKQGKPIHLSRSVIAFLAANPRQQQPQSQGENAQPVTMKDLEQLNDQLGSPTGQTSQPQQGAPQ